MHQKVSNYTLDKAAYNGICAETIQTTVRFVYAVWQETEMAASVVALFTDIVWASWWKIRESRFKWRWFQHHWYKRKAKYNSIDRLYRPLNCICTEKICRASRHFQFFGWCWSKCDVTSGTLAMATIVGLFVDSQPLMARSQNRTKCVKYVWLSYPTWPSRWVLCISMQWLRLKGCQVACDEWTSGEICSLQHVGHRLCHVGSSEWRVTKIWGPSCERD